MAKRVEFSAHRNNSPTVAPFFKIENRHRATIFVNNVKAPVDRLQSATIEKFFRHSLTPTIPAPDYPPTYNRARNRDKLVICKTRAEIHIPNLLALG